MNKNKSDIINALEIGISKGKKAKRKQKIINSNIIGLVLVLVSFSVSVNVSGTFADSLMNVPVLGKLVDLITFGSGFEEVAERGYYVEGDIVVEDENYIVSIENYYYSDHDINIILKLDGKLNENYRYMIDDIKIVNKMGEKLSYTSMSHGPFTEANGTLRTNVTITSRNELLPEACIFIFSIREHKSTFYSESYTKDEKYNNVEEEKYYIYEHLKVNLEKQVKEKDRVIEINKTIKIQDFNIIVKELVMTPTTMNLYIEVQSEDMEFYGFDSLYFESGSSRFNLISNGMSRTGNYESGFIYFFESNYFDDKPLTLVIDGILALPKNESTIVIDLEKEEMLVSIDDHLKLKEVVEHKDYYDIHFIGYFDESIQFSTYNSEYFTSRSVMNNEELNLKEYVLELDKSLVIEKIITIEFSSYPNHIEFNKKIEIGE